MLAYTKDLLFTKAKINVGLYSSNNLNSIIYQLIFGRFNIRKNLMRLSSAKNSQTLFGISLLAASQISGIDPDTTTLLCKWANNFSLDDRKSYLKQAILSTCQVSRYSLCTPPTYCLFTEQYVCNSIIRHICLFFF